VDNSHPYIVNLYPMVQFEPDDSNVAVIAIHGVGQHVSAVSADAVSTLLQSIGRNGAANKNGETGNPPYSGFITTSIEVPLRPVQSAPEDAEVANDRHKHSLRSRVWGMFDERRGYLSAVREKSDYKPHGYEKRELRPSEPDRGEYGYRFMLTQLAGYVGDVDRNFQTVRLEGKRRADSRAATVHIYDAHYSDLTKPQSNILSFFLAFYQLLFHLASLSLQAVYWAEAENVAEEAERVKAEARKTSTEGTKVKKNKGRIWRWRVGSSVHATSVRLLIMWVPFLNLIILEIAASAFADKTVGQPWLPVLSFGFASVLSLVATFLLVRQWPSPSRPFLWSAIPFFGTGLGVLVLSALAGLYNQAFDIQLPFLEVLLLFGWLLAAGAILGVIGKKYDPLRPGAFWLAIALYLANVSFFLFYLLPHAAATAGVDNAVATASLWAVQWIFGELLICWILCLLSALLAWPLSMFCVHGIGDDTPPRKARRARATAAFRTGRFAFAVPAILFMIVTCALWSGVVVYGAGKLKAFDAVSLPVATQGLASQKLPSLVIPKIGTVEHWINRIGPRDEQSSSASVQNVFWGHYLTGLLLVSVTPALPVTMIVFVLSLLLLTWAVLPSVIFELKPEWTRDAKSNRIRWLGEWVSRGLDNTAILTRLLWFAIVPIPLFFFAFDWLALREYPPFNLGGALDNASRLTLPLIKYQGLVLAVSGAAVFGSILKYLTTVLDTILDVDNYLRTSPIDHTPRARIAERCTSLLRYIATYRDSQNRPYSKVIIVAHSLGSMVTTDLLRYLERSAGDSPDPGLAAYGFRRSLGVDQKLPIYVFSMGCPLRQLLNRFFPHLYWWVSDIPDNSDNDLGLPVGPPPAIDSPLPRSDEMNVTLWSNAYRSGDYVGRSLWVGQWLERNKANDTSQGPDVASTKAPQSCTEMCIGLGAHTHYWDRTAPDVAKQLDQLIT